MKEPDLDEIITKNRWLPHNTLCHQLTICLNMEEKTLVWDGVEMFDH
jgi:hypothetical protein